MAADDDKWLPLASAAERAGLPYETLRRLAKTGVFTRKALSKAEKRPPVFLHADELDAWKRGGVEALRKVQDARGKRPAKKSKV